MDGTPPLSAGVFGKMPALGDFLRAGLPAGFVTAWDSWLQAGMSAARENLGHRWEDCYLTAPIWRFTLAPGLAGPQAVQGVLMASVDRVGRQFPLTLATTDTDGSAASHFAASARFAALDALALAALEDDMTRDRLLDGLAALPAMPQTARAPGTPGTLAMRCADPAAALAATAPALAGSGVFFSAPLETDDLFLALPALPVAARFAAMLDPSAPLWTDGAA